MKIWLDMDGTIANLYGVNGWLDMLIASDPTPYAIAKPLINMSRLARALNRLQAKGHEIGIISWLSRDSSEEYDSMVDDAKRFWLQLHLKSVHWDTIHIVPYGRDKWEVGGEGILFDDEARNRENWGGQAYTPEEIFDVLNKLLAAE